MLNNLKRRWGPVISSWFPLEFWHRLSGVKLLLPRYHVVGGEEPAHVCGLGLFRKTEQFKADMEYFLKFYTPVSLQAIISHLDGASRLPERCFLPTFDDGFRETYDVIAPVLWSQGIPAAFFLNPSVLDNRELLREQKKSLLVRAVSSLGDSPERRRVVQVLNYAGIQGQELPSCIRGVTHSQRQLLDELGRVLEIDFMAYAASARPYLTSEQARDLLRQGFEIGAHSVDHPLYSGLDLEKQLLQTRESLGYLSEHFQYACRSFAFPYMDTGISLEFFQQVFADGRLQVSFGSDGMHRHFFPRNLERFKMEYPDFKALQILAREFFLAISRKPAWSLVE